MQRFLSLSSSSGKLSANSELEFLRKLWLAVLHKFCRSIRHGFHPTSRILDMEERVAQVSAQDTLDMFMFISKNELVCEPLVDTTCENLGEHVW